MEVRIVTVRSGGTGPGAEPGPRADTGLDARSGIRHLAYV
jgi:hypothetical protein